MGKAGRLLTLMLLLSACAQEEAVAPVIPAEIGWTALAAMDPESGSRPASLREQLSKPVRIHGYAVPLDAFEQGVTSFILVPDRMYCVHVPPPPPNQLVLVELKKPLDWRVLESGLWLTGSLIVDEEKSEFGGFMYKMKELNGLERADW